MTALRIVRTRRGARIVDGGAVLSEILRRPGAAHRFVDVMAATVAALAPSDRFLMLGFAGGGLVGPLRGAGWEAAIAAVDLDRQGEELFRELCGSWAGEVRLEIDDAARWLERNREQWDLVMDDLSVPGNRGVTKPRISYGDLPAAIAARLAPNGIAVCNLLRVPGLTWATLESAVAGSWPRALVISADDYENRLLVVGAQLPTARAAGRRVRDRLRALRSSMLRQVRVRTLANDGSQTLLSE